jgi:DNA-binding beta-propeller fold protein YncE
MLKHLVIYGPVLRRRSWAPLLERLENQLCFSTRSERVAKRHLLIVILVGIVMTTFLPCAYADLYVISENSNSILRYNEVTGAFIGELVSSGSGGLNNPKGLLFARDGNLYVTSANTNTVMRYDGTTGAPLPAPGQMGAVFVPNRSGGLQNPAQLILGRDGNLYVNSQDNNSVLRYDGTTGAFIDAFIRSGSGGLSTPRGLVFGPDGNLYINSSDNNK